MSRVRVTTSTLHASLAKGVSHDSLKAKSTRSPAMVRREEPIPTAEAIVGGLLLGSPGAALPPELQVRVRTHAVNPEAGRVADVSRHCGHDRGTGRVGSGIGRVW